MVIDLIAYTENKQSEAAALIAQMQAESADEMARRVKLEWVLLDLLTEIHAA